jgi:hypothetical protein
VTINGNSSVTSALTNCFWTTSVARLAKENITLAIVIGGEIGAIERDRPIDQPDHNFRPTARARHQRVPPDHAQTGGVVTRGGCAVGWTRPGDACSRTGDTWNVPGLAAHPQVWLQPVEEESSGTQGPQPRAACFSPTGCCSPVGIDQGLGELTAGPIVAARANSLQNTVVSPETVA